LPSVRDRRAVPFLAKQLTPVAAPDPEQVQRLLADLDSARFTVRQAAARALSSIVEQPGCAAAGGSALTPASSSEHGLAGSLFAGTPSDVTVMARQVERTH
jgi:hypothetical protein